MNWQRRQCLQWGGGLGGLATLGLAGCERFFPTDDLEPNWARLQAHHSGYAHESFAVGHRLRSDAFATPAAAAPLQRSACLVLGAGVAGLAAARALLQQGVSDVQVLDLADTPGGNARGATLAGLAHPLGAHYLPVPTAAAVHVQALLEDLGVRQRKAGRWHYDERVLCHSPQERLFFRGAWQDGLLPLADVGEQTLAQYQRFHQHVAAWQKTQAFSIPVQRHTQTDAVRALHGLSFAQHLAAHAFVDAHLLWYLDYCCRDEYGAGMAVVSAYAGIHYFAARHGFDAVSHEGADSDERSAVLTWPQGNAFLTQAMAQPLIDGGRERLRLGRLITRIEPQRHGVHVQAWHAASQTLEQYWAPMAVCALPAMLVGRVLTHVPSALGAQIQSMAYSAWTVSNLLLDHTPSMPWRANFGQQMPINGMPQIQTSADQLAWDNVLYGSTSLGYVHAQHQSTDPRGGATVVTHYQAHGVATQQRRALLDQTWQNALLRVLADLRPAHPELARDLRACALTRYGHAMRVPLAGQDFTAQAQPVLPRLAFAHSDWAGYSVFEEAYEQGLQAAEQIRRWRQGRMS